MYIDKDELMELLEEKFGDLDNNGGCYLTNGTWLSIKQIVNTIEECTEYDD